MFISTCGKLFVVVLVAVTCMTACSEDKSWSDLHKESVRLFVKHDLDGAMAMEKRAMAMAEKTSPNDPRIIKSLRVLATIARLKGRTEEAIPLYKQAIAISDMQEEDSDIEISVRDLASAYIGLGRFAEAEPLLKRLILISEKKYGKMHPAVAKELKNLAMLYKSMGRDKDSSDYAARAAAISIDVYKGHEKNY